MSKGSVKRRLHPGASALTARRKVALDNLNKMLEAPNMIPESIKRMQKEADRLKELIG